jgi:hypothetical protein
VPFLDFSFDWVSGFDSHLCRIVPTKPRNRGATMHFRKNKEINQLVQELIQFGWSYAKGRQYKLFPHDSRGMFIVTGTLGDRHAFQNFRRDMGQRLRGFAERYRDARQELMP